MRKEETIDLDKNLIKENNEESLMTKCEMCEVATTCMRTLCKKTCHAQRNKPSKSIDEIANKIFEYIYICPDCFFVNQRQLVLNQLVSAGISDKNLTDCVSIMDSTPSKQTRYEFKIRTG